jgi:phosphoglucomutase
MISIDQEFSISKIPTTAYNDQKPGTSGLRKKTTVVQQPNYIENFMQSLLLSVRPDELSCYNVLVAGGDGRYHNLSALYTLIDIAAANGIDELHIGH